MLCVFYRKYYVNCLDMTCNIEILQPENGFGRFTPSE